MAHTEAFQVTLPGNDKTLFGAIQLVEPEKPVVTIVNLTPHAINVVNWPEIPAPTDTNFAARVVEAETEYGFSAFISHVENLPAYQPNTDNHFYYVVSRATAYAALVKEPYRHDLFVPGEVVRDGTGKIIGVNNLVRILHKDFEAHSVQYAYNGGHKVVAYNTQNGVPVVIAKTFGYQKLVDVLRLMTHVVGLENGVWKNIHTGEVVKIVSNAVYQCVLYPTIIGE